jgi:hypothetical protein
MENIWRNKMQELRKRVIYQKNKLESACHSFRHFHGALERSRLRSRTAPPTFATFSWRA